MINGSQAGSASGPRSKGSKLCTEDGGTISPLGPRSNVSKHGTKDGRNENIRLRPELFGEKCESCGDNTLYADNISTIVKITKNKAARTALKIDFIIAELGKILQSNGLILNADKTELLRTTTRQQLAANGEERLIIQTKNKRGREPNLIIRAQSFKSHLEIEECADSTTKEENKSTEVPREIDVRKAEKELGRGFDNE